MDATKQYSKSDTFVVFQFFYLYEFFLLLDASHLHFVLILVWFHTTSFFMRINCNFVSMIRQLTVNAVCVWGNIQGAPKNFTPWSFLIIFPKRLRIFKQNFTRLLSIQIYANLQNFIQLSPTLTKLCRIRRDHPPNFYISQHVHHEFY